MTWTILLIKKNDNGWFINYLKDKLTRQIIQSNLQEYIKVLIFEPNQEFYGDYINTIDDFIEISDNYIETIYNILKNSTKDCIGLKGVIYIDGKPSIFNNISGNKNEIYLPTTKLNPIRKDVIFKNIKNIVYYLNSNDLSNIIKTKDNINIPVLFLEKTTTKIPISIIITAYKSQKFIEECLDSIENQTYFVDNDNFEILVGVDGCESTYNKLNEIKHKYRNLHIYMMAENKGTYITTNTLIGLVKNEDVIRFDSDDIMMSNLVKETIKNKKDNDIVMLGYSDLKNNKIENKFSLASGIIYFKKSIMDNIAGGYMPWICGADTELITRLANRVKISQINKALFYRRIHDGSLTNRPETGPGSEIRENYRNQIKIFYNNDEIKIDRVINIFLAQESDLIGSKKIVSVNMATYPLRKESFIKCIKQLLTIDIIDIIRVYLNEYQAIPKEFPMSNKIIYFIGKENLKDTGKFYWASENKNEYYFTIDDDFLYTNSYFSNHINSLKKYKNKVFVTLHGKIMNDNPKHINDCKNFYHFSQEMDKDICVNNGGTGLMVFDNSIYSLPLDMFKYHGMCDLWVASYCQKNKIPIICRKHNVDELFYIGNKISLFSQRNEMIDKHLEILKSIEKWNLYDNKIPKRIFFYWGGSDMSWMRYMTFYSFKKMNPDWEVVLYVSDNEIKNKGWKTSEDQDYYLYKGENYFDRLKKLNIKIEKAEFPADVRESLKKLSPIHKSDLFRYYQLYKNGGIYCDTDVIFFRPIDDFYKEIINNNYDTIIHEYQSDAITLTIGLLGSSINNEYYKDLFEFGVNYYLNNTKESEHNYQSMGVQLIYKMFTGNPYAIPVYNKIISKYPNLNFYNLPTSLIYKFDWTKIKYCFTHAIKIENFDQNSIGYHWYGGGIESQKYNAILNENNYKDYKITFSIIADEIIKKIETQEKEKPKISIIMSSFNRPQLLNLGLSSILNQKIDYPFETIVVNDGSNDDTENICNLYKDKLNIKYIFSGYRNLKKLTSRPPGFALNIGIKNSTGDIIILTCPEIYHRNNSINEIIKPLIGNNNYLTIPKFMYFDDIGEYTNELLSNSNNSRLDLCNINNDDVQMPFLMGIWKKKILDIGGYDEDFIGYAGDDNDFVDRLKLNGCDHYRVNAEIIHLYHGKRCSGVEDWNNPEWAYNYKLYKERKNIMIRNVNKEWGNNIRISIVTAYYNRKKLFYETLKSIAKSKIKDFELIVVDDGSSSEQRLEEYINEFSFLKIIRLEPENKWYTNPCIPFNIGIRAAIGDIIILQNPESLHVHDILSYVNENIDDTKYITMSAYALDETLTQTLIEHNKNNTVNDFMKSLINNKYTHKTFGLSDVGNIGWYNHSIYLPSYFHFCSAITKKNMDLLGGFDERYANGISYDDNDFVERVNRLGLNKIINDDISVFHQYHEAVYYKLPNFRELHERNKLLFENVTKKETKYNAN